MPAVQPESGAGTARQRWLTWQQLLTRVGPEVVVFVALVVFARHRGQDVNYDQRNYHFLYAYQFLHGLLANSDPSLVGQHYFNPLVNVPWTVGVETLSPRVLTVAVVAVQSLNFALVRRLAERCLGQRRWLALLAAGLGISAPTFLSEVGTSFTDASMSLLVLGALALLLRGGRWAPAVAGVLAGAATGLKLTNAVYVAGLLAALCWLALAPRSDPAAPRASRFGPLRWALAGSAAGAASTYLWWGVYLWRQTGSPFFPYYNSIFRSELLPPVDLYDQQFRSSGLAGRLRLPYDLTTGQAHVLEQPLRDARWLVLVLLAGVLIAARLLRRRPAGQSSPNRAAAAVVVFAVVSGALWGALFGYARYLVPVELLSGLLIALGCLAVLRRERTTTVAVALVGVALLGWAQIPDWGHQPGFTQTWFDLDPAVLAGLPAEALVVTSQDADPVSYAARWLPPTVDLVALSQGIFRAGHPDLVWEPGRDYLVGTGLDRAVRAKLVAAGRRGRPIFVLRGATDPSTLLRPFGVLIDAGCRVFPSRTDPGLQLCPAHLDLELLNPALLSPAPVR